MTQNEAEYLQREQERLANLEAYSILDTLPESDYDNITAIAAEICGVPIALVSLLDNRRQWFKSHHGLAATETPKHYAFCAHAIKNPDEIFVVEDARQDKRFQENPLVWSDPNVIFYAGVPLKNETGHALGTLCVIDNEPKTLTPNQIQSLKALSNQVMNLLELRKKKLELEMALKEIEQKNQELERFAYLAAHDIRSPLKNISTLAKLTLNTAGPEHEARKNQIAELIASSAEKLTGMVEGLLKNSQINLSDHQEKSPVNLTELLNDIEGLLFIGLDGKLTLQTELKIVYTNKTAIEQIILNLVNNAIKYNDKTAIEINIAVSEKENNYEFRVTDNGPGIKPEEQSAIFDLFRVMTPADRFGKTGSGIGLATVKKLVQKLGGFIKVESQPGKGATFIFTIKKHLQPEVNTVNIKTESLN